MRKLQRVRHEEPFLAAQDPRRRAHQLPGVITKSKWRRRPLYSKWLEMLWAPFGEMF
jgi:hypothetical protein